MRAPSILLALAALAVVWLGATPSAHALRCGTRLVTVGDSAAYVRSVCGDPTSLEETTRTRSAGFVSRDGFFVGDSVTIPVQIWTYDFGPRRFIEQLVFESGVLVSMRPMGYGTRASLEPPTVRAWLARAILPRRSALAA